MIRPVSPTRPLRPLEALRQSSDQIRQAADILADLTADTADLELPRARLPGTQQLAAATEATILKAQRSFVASRHLRQTSEDPKPEP